MNPSTDLHRLALGPVIPVSDLRRSIAFYHDVLGLAGEPAPGGGYVLHAGDGCAIYLLAGTDYSGRAAWPLAGFRTDDLLATLADLRARGVEPATDIPQPVDQNGIAEFDGMRIAWFTDPDDQVLSIFQLTDPIQRTDPIPEEKP